MFMPRAELHMSDDEIEQFLTDNYWGRIGTVNASGEPHVTPIAYFYCAGSVYFAGLSKSRRTRDILATGKVSLCVDDGVAPGEGYERRRGVVVYGNCVVVSDDPVVESEVIPRMVALSGAAPHSAHKMFRIEKTHWVSWDFRRIPKEADYHFGNPPTSSAADSS
jgi:hypothetical protein